jgi:hypothetical protein
LLLEMEYKLDQVAKDREALLGDTLLKYHLTSILLERYPGENSGFLTELKKTYENNAFMAVYMNYINSIQNKSYTFSGETYQQFIQGMSDNAKHKMGTRFEVLYALRLKLYGEKGAKNFCLAWMDFVDGKVELKPARISGRSTSTTVPGDEEEFKQDDLSISDNIAKLKDEFPSCDHCGISTNRWILFKCSKNLNCLPCVESGKNQGCGRNWVECAACNGATCRTSNIKSRGVVPPQYSEVAKSLPVNGHIEISRGRAPSLWLEDNCPRCKIQLFFLYYCTNKYPCKGTSHSGCSNKYKCKKLAALHCLKCSQTYCSSTKTALPSERKSVKLDLFDF